MGEHREGDITEPYQAGQTIDPTVTEQGETNEGAPETPAERSDELGESADGNTDDGAVSER